MNYANEIVLNMVKPGDIVEIVPIEKVPNVQRKFKVDYINDSGFIYDVSTTCDGYVIPFNWIKEIKIIN